MAIPKENTALALRSRCIPARHRHCRSGRCNSILPWRHTETTRGWGCGCRGGSRRTSVIALLLLRKRILQLLDVLLHIFAEDAHVIRANMPESYPSLLAWYEGYAEHLSESQLVLGRLLKEQKSSSKLWKQVRCCFSMSRYHRGTS